MKSVIVSGIKPSGTLHIGNYLGMTKQSLDLQHSDKHDCYYFIADYHSLTQKYSVKEKTSEILNLAIDLLSLGIDPDKSVFFTQSDVLEHTNLAWLLNCVTPSGQLQGMIEFKEKIEQGQAASAGLLNYPVLMAADILIYKAKFVPVGEDQRQHLELGRDISRIFNKRFGYLFPEPKGIFVEGFRIKSLDNPEKKMSKSIPKGCLYLNDDPKDIKKKIQSAVTDSGKEIVFDPLKKPALANLLLIYSGILNIPINEIVRDNQGMGYKEFKDMMTENILPFFISFQNKRKIWAENNEKIKKIMFQGAEKARAVASQTLRETKEKMGLIA